jgi:hypothetical protein
MKTIFRTTDRFLADVRRDLARPHRFAAERVGFISIRAASTAASLVLLGESYHPVADDDYIDDTSVGAMMGQEAIRKALNIALLQPVGMIHVHMHEHKGRPGFSPTDRREQLKFVPDFFKVRRQMPHGAIVLSHDQAIGRVWLDPETVVGISEFNTIGSHVIIDMNRPVGRRLDFTT